MRFLTLFLLLFIATPISAQRPKEPIVGLPCEGCEAVFDGLPVQINSRARIANRSEKGVPMIVVGKVLDSNGKPKSGVIVYAYQTNSSGIYPESSAVRDPETRRQGTLRAWVKTDTSGRYALDTIRPGSYPNSDLPEHIHFHIVEPGCSTYYIDDIMFTDDPKLTPKQIRRIAKNRGGNGISTPVMKEGVWHVTRDIYLGKNIPGYRACAG
jgi:protocatechuate 3,4-dioxygenase beta subunit